MLTPLKSEAVDVADLSHEARRFRTIANLFRRNLELIFSGGTVPAVDNAALAEAFSRWRATFEDSKAVAEIDRQDFVVFAAGLMLKELIVADPLKGLGLPAAGAGLPASGKDTLLGRWPQGYTYASYCLSLAAAVIKETDGIDLEPAAIADDPRFWDSFRDNSAESPEAAVGYFDMICAREPNWSAPHIASFRAAVRQRIVASRPAAVRGQP